MKLSEIKETGTRIEKGAWVSRLPNLPGISIKVRGAFNSDYNRRFSELAASYTPEQLKDEAVQKDIDTTLLVETIIEDWDGIEDFPCTDENKRLALTDPSLSLLRRAANYAANNVAVLGRESIEEAAKN
jgi:hypothetical protein